MILYHSPTSQQPSQDGPTTPSMQRLPAITHTRFGLLRVRSPLLTESRLFSSPMGTEMFHFPTFPPTTLYIQVEVAGHNSGLFRGFPIRTSTDQSSFTNSPWLIAGYNVLHRLLMPRHPPIALSSLSPKNSTTKNYKDARVHYTILKHPTNTNTPPPHESKAKGCHQNNHNHQRLRKPQNPTTCTPPHPPPPAPFHTQPPQGNQAVLRTSTNRHRNSINASTTNQPPTPHTNGAESRKPDTHQQQAPSKGSLERR